MDKIFLNELAFYGYHGVYGEEQKLGQRFIVDLVLFVDLTQAGKTDDLNQTINYGEVYQQVKQIVEGPPFKLVEAVAEKIADELLKTFPLLESCTVKVIKPDPPIVGHYKSVAVEITRARS
ncbi:dihydroneopterin aldolase [Halalkalibacter akibai]|uniref:7,8-dihydroneopterin aldolase n=1 Tax=Halalkalibacter akibai (strain ATCC 43226 / DSM 21942 / CIP 109018 / JCM 9157 / 1139) TaxID=1236973 RepID=W4R052_HALA3|nr:dihydroneopterin aldolase [Halalkalibacter akibai]GAE37298.1 dihydroneopterin aldolase [Halalkalibacter akibai JCM 9157]